MKIRNEKNSKKEMKSIRNQGEKHLETIILLLILIKIVIMIIKTEMVNSDNIVKNKSNKDEYFRNNNNLFILQCKNCRNKEIQGLFVY